MTDRRDNFPPPEGWHTESRPNPLAPVEPPVEIEPDVILGEN